MWCRRSDRPTSTSVPTCSASDGVESRACMPTRTARRWPRPARTWRRTGSSRQQRRRSSADAPGAAPSGGLGQGGAMTDSSGPPFRADHVGSLLRPKNLLDARARRAAGEIDDAELRGIEDEAISDAVRMQADVGLRTATDGEFRRASWHMDFIYA